MPTPLLVAAFTVTLLTGALGLRLLFMASRTRRLPELLMGLFFACASLLGYLPILYVVSRPELAEQAPELVRMLRGLYYAGLSVPPATIAIFSWRVFEPQSRVAAVAACALATAAVMNAAVLGGRGVRADSLDPAVLTSTCVRVVAFGWACAEALRQYARSRRRAALGLADPIVTNRFLLWAIWSAAPVGMTLIPLLSRAAYGAALPADGPVALLTRGVPILLGAICGGAVWLTFFPPGFYRRLIEARADGQVPRPDGAG